MTGGGSGGGSGGGTGGGSTGGGGGSTVTGGGGGSTGGGGGEMLCPTLNCAEACVEGTGCVPFFAEIRITAPDSGTFVRESTLTLEAELVATTGVTPQTSDYPPRLSYSIRDGGSQLMQRDGMTSRYSTQYVATNCANPSQISWTVSLEDGGFPISSTFACDGQNPTLILPAFSSGYYQRDDVIIFDLDADEELNKSSVEVKLAGVTATESSLGSDGGSCDARGKCWSLDFSKPELHALDAGFALVVNGSDVAGNASPSQVSNLKVTRLRWETAILPSHRIIAAPATNAVGDVFIGSTNPVNDRTGGLFRINPLNNAGSDAGVGIGAVQGVAIASAATQMGMPPDVEYAFVTFNTEIGSNTNGRLHAFNTSTLAASPGSVCQAYGNNSTFVAPALVRTDGDQVAAVASTNGGGGDDGRFVRWDSRLGCNKSVDLSGLSSSDLNHDPLEPPMNTIVANASTTAFAYFIRPIFLANQLRRVTGLRSTVSVETTAESLDGGGATSQTLAGSETIISNLKTLTGPPRVTRTSFGGMAREWDLGNNVSKGAVVIDDSNEAFVGNGSQIVRFDPTNAALGPVNVFTATGQTITLSPVLLAARPGTTNDWGYAISNSGSIVAFDRHGTSVGWSAPLRSSGIVLAHPGFGCNTKPNHAPGTGILYVAWRDGVVQAIVVDGSELKGLWPKYQRSMGNAGNDDTAFFPTNWTCP